MICIDASVAVKWTVEERHHSEAIELAGSEQVLIAPDLLLYEVHSVLRRKLKKGEVDAEQVKRAIHELPTVLDLLVPLRSLFEQATHLSTLLDHPVYDCSYLACAVQYDAMLVTADGHFARKLFATPYAGRVLELGISTKGELQRNRDELGVEFQALQLWRVFESTLSNVTTRVSRPFGSSGAVLYSSGDLKPAFDSPAYVRLHRFIAALDLGERAKLLALAWFGRSYMRSDWSSVLQQAKDYFSGRDSDPISYTISTFHTLEAGIQKMQLTSKKPS